MDGWADAWRDFHRPVREGRLWVGPPWSQPEPIAVVIDPGRAFGTGAHGSTRAALALLQELEPGPALDLGCGSGVLSIAAAKLGFGPLQAFDIDPLAVQATHINAARNDVELSAERRDVLIDPLPPARLWLANLELHLLEPLLRRPDRPPLVLASGLLERQTLGGATPGGGGRLGSRVGGTLSGHVYRFFARDLRDGVAQLSDGDRRHLEQVLRLPVGDTCEIVWEGRVFRARVRSDGYELIEEVEALPKAPSVTVWIAQPGARSDEAVEKLTELGVARIGPLRTELLKGSFSESRLERWARVAEAAAKQSKQSRLPELLAPSAYADVLSREAVVLSNTGASGGLADRIVGRRSATLLIGPEPGFSDAELELARSRGVAVATFGPVVLRTETAAIVAAALALREMGFLG